MSPNWMGHTGLDAGLLPLAQAGGADCLSTGLMFLGMLMIFYFLLIRPQIKEQQKLEDVRSSLKVDDRVMTSGGVFGRIVELEEDRVTLEVSPRTRLKVARQHVMQKDENAKGKEEVPPPLTRRKGSKKGSKDSESESDEDRESAERS